MVQRSVPLVFSFFLALIATAYLNVFFPHIRVHTFVPFLALLYSRCSRMSSFWIGSLCGLIVDLLGSELRLGAYAFSFSIATLLLYHQKQHFYHEKPLALSLFTFQLSLVVNSVLFLFSYLSQVFFQINLKWFIVDFLLMSAFDSIYAFFWFSCPILLYVYLKRIGLQGFFSKVHSLKRRRRIDP